MFYHVSIVGKNIQGYQIANNYFVLTLTSSHHNTLYNAPTIGPIVKDLVVVVFPELLGTHTVSHRLFWKWNNCNILPHYTNTILMYMKTFNNHKAAQRQFLGALN